MAIEIIWTIAQRADLIREFELWCAGSPTRDQAVTGLLSKFEEELSLLPMEWPVSKTPPSEHTWTFGRISVRYRLIPNGQAVQILSIMGAKST